MALDDVFEINTDRLRLRSWREEDLPIWAEMNANPEVRRYFPGTQTPEQSAESVERFQAFLVEHGFGPWAVELTVPVSYEVDRRKRVLEPGTFIGSMALYPMPDVVPTLPDGTEVVWELGWRLRPEAWHQGFATEGASAMRDYAFGIERFKLVGSYTTAANASSRRVMERIGMRLALEFDNPNLPEHLRQCVVYTMTDGDWRNMHPNLD
ncbi:MAG: GNAT family N-acetyltransferase [Actinomycetaceae bacterium]|nr:GNAT family N-acetyltransferase [Actinomycetaceae bacterium]